jgi:hypothetical protein
VRGIADLEREVFGPVLHIATFRAEAIDAVIAEINATGYGLTFGLHTRIDTRVEEIARAIRAGNVYVNRNQIGAVVGSQPFGGEPACRARGRRRAARPMSSGSAVSRAKRRRRHLAPMSRLKPSPGTSGGFRARERGPRPSAFPALPER